MHSNKKTGFKFPGFSMKKQSEVVPPPPTATYSKHGYHTMTAISQNAVSGSYNYGQSRKRLKTEEEYFEDEDETIEEAYQPAPGSPGPTLKEDSDSDDPLDAFMAGIDQEVKRQGQSIPEDDNKSSKQDNKGFRDDIEEEDDEESYYRYMEENPNAGRQIEESDEEIEYDEEGNPIVPDKPKYIDPLPPLDHSTITYEDFNKNFYVEHEEIANLDREKVVHLRNKLGIRVSGFSAPKPVSSFGHFGFDDALMKVIRKSEYSQPTPIQAQAVPIAMSGRDLIGIAKTGSGKTAAFVWPLLIHIMDQKELEPGDGPIGLILAPTRELAQQIYVEAKRFGKTYNIHVVCAYGGGSKWEQSKALEAGAEIVVATPGRMIDMVKIKATNLQRVTFIVLDEADRMFDMGFEPQVRSICDHVRPDRQTLLFSATFKKKIEKLARDVLTDPIRIVQGELGEANEDVEQKVEVFTVAIHKWNWLLARLVQFMSAGSVLIFVTKKLNAEELCKNLNINEFEACLMHGDMTQFERNKVIMSFKKKEIPCMVATDVAARGLDIPHIKTVINYDVARDIDTHTHRIGRTGRAGEKGEAYTLVTDKDKEFAGHIIRNLEGANQTVPKALLDLAMQSSWFRKSRVKSSKAKVIGGRGLGYKERPGLRSKEGESISPANSNSAPVGPAGQAYGSISNAGPASNRLAAMKAAFHSQYKHQFITGTKNSPWSSEVTEAANNEGNNQEPPAPQIIDDRCIMPPPSRRKKKSRWE